MSKRGKKQWPSWRYGPDGARRVFQENEPIPAGWVDHPSKVQEPSKVKKLGVDTDLNGTETIPEIEAAYAEGRVTLDQIEVAEATRAKPRDGIMKFVEEQRVRLQARSDAFSVLREAGVDIPEDATDEELTAALDALEG
jgi:hypothetical protein